MSYDYTLVDNLPTLNPESAYANAARNATPTTFSGRANSIVLRRGHAPSQAWMIMLKRDLDKLQASEAKSSEDKTPLHNIKWISSDLGGMVEFKNWVLVDAVALDRHYQGSTTTAYLVYFEDFRRLFQRSSVARQFNVRIPAPTRTSPLEYLYYHDTLKADTTDPLLTTYAPFTWDQILAELWTCLHEALSPGIDRPLPPILPYVPTSTPENFRFVGVSAWEAFCAVLEAAHCTYVYDPILDSHLIIRTGAAQAEYVDASRAWSKRLIFDAAAPPDSDVASMPQIVRVFFRKRITYAGIERDTPDVDNWELDPWYTKDQTMNLPKAYGVLPVWADIDAMYDDQTGPTNSTEINDRAAEIADDIKQRLTNTGTIAKYYSGLIINVLPGSQVDRVVWRNYGDGNGTITEWLNDTAVETEPEVLRSVLRPVDLHHMVRPNFPQYAQMVRITGAWEGNDYEPVYPGKVAINNGGVWTTLEDCFVMPTSRTDIHLDDSQLTLTASDRFHGPARLSGLHTSHGITRPLYLLEDTFPRKPFVEFELDGDLDTSTASAQAKLTAEWGPGPSAGPTDGTTTITVLNARTHTAGLFKYHGVAGRVGYAIHVADATYRIIDMEC